MERIAAIAGIHEYPLRVAPGVSSMQIKAESMKQALDDAGLSWGMSMGSTTRSTATAAAGWGSPPTSASTRG